MKFVWDEPKRLANIAKHDGLDFADLDETFFERSIIVPGKGNRLIAVGRLANGVVVEAHGDKVDVAALKSVVEGIDLGKVESLKRAAK